MSEICKTYMLSALKKMSENTLYSSNDDEMRFYLSQGLDIIKGAIEYVYSGRFYQYTPVLLPVPDKLKQAFGILQEEIININYVFVSTHYDNHKEFFELCERIYTLLAHIINGQALIIRPLEDK